jgi:hypothetical protein
MQAIAGEAKRKNLFISGALVLGALHTPHRGFFRRK